VLRNLLKNTEDLCREKCGRSRVKFPVKDRVIPKTLKWYQ